jgi:hypothetical protein
MCIVLPEYAANLSCHRPHPVSIDIDSDTQEIPIYITTILIKKST